MADLGTNWTSGDSAGEGGTFNQTQPDVKGRLDGNCIQCGVSVNNFLSTMTPDGPLHNECIPKYQRSKVERCAHCDNVLKLKRTILNGTKLHPECVADYKAKNPYVRPSKQGMLNKFAVGRSMLGSKNWKERFFIISPDVNNSLAYYENEAAFREGKPPKNVVSIDPKTTRLITHPNKQIHPQALNPSTEMIVVFFEEGKERRLLMEAKGYEEHDDWVRVLECYIKIIDDPKDIAD